MSKTVDLPAHLPLTEPTLFILLSLSTTPKHGYAIMKEVQALSESRVILSTSTLYGALKRLLDQDWIVRVDDPNESENGRERKAYQLTPAGRHILEAEIARLQALVALARRQTAGASP